MDIYNDDSKRGLASAPQEVRERVARQGGKASHKRSKQANSSEENG